ncbi:MAG TPA: DUF5666 domain-containing protein [Thermoflexales bacterium]|nr:DUF5666 domain-containing protein [Thermoflexales bacterium]HQW33818.1 DUF5666 domain-containing protein [Thermoflexales bacterium]
MNKKIGIGMGVLASLALAGGMAFAQGGNPPNSETRAGGAANAANTARAGRIINGVVSAINGQTLVLGGQGGNRNAADVPSSENTDVAFYAPMDAGVTARRAVSITTNAQTKFYVAGKTNPTLADVSVGDRVAMLADAPAAQGQPPLAKAVTVIPLPAHAFLAGEVSDLSATGFRLTTPNGAEKASISLAASTKVIVPGAANGALANGDRVALRAKPLGDKSFEAELVLVKPGDAANALNGMVASVSGNTLIVWTPRGASVSVDAASAAFARPNETLANVRVGETVRVYGIWNADKTAMTAQLIGDLGGAVAPRNAPDARQNPAPAPIPRNNPAPGNQNRKP